MRFFVLNQSRLSLHIQMRRNLPDHFHRPHTVRNGHDGIAIHTFACSPVSPLTIHSLRRVAQNSIKVKKHS